MLKLKDPVIESSWHGSQSALTCCVHSRKPLFLVRLLRRKEGRAADRFEKRLTACLEHSCAIDGFTRHISGCYGGRSRRTEVVLPGAAEALRSCAHPRLAFCAVRRRDGDHGMNCRQYKNGAEQARSVVHHTDVCNRHGRQAEHRRSGSGAARHQACGRQLRPVERGRGTARFMSAGNTGALMAMAKVVPQDHSRAYPASGHCRRYGRRSERPQCIVLDMGATVGADA